MVHADVADEDGVLGQGLVDLDGGTLGIDWRGLVLHPRGDEGVPLGAIGIDLGQPLPARARRAGIVAAAIELSQELAQEGTHVGHQPERDRIVAADFLRVDIDMDELRRRDRERVALQPGAGGPVVEADAEGQKHIGLAAGVVRLIRAAALDEPKRQRMLDGNGAEAAGGGGHGDLKPLGQLQ